MSSPKKFRKTTSSRSPEPVDREAEVRIVGGRFRGRRLSYHGDQVVRPMKHRTREAIFNLIGTEVAGRHAVDLFAGTGALGLEALSRGALSATFIEKHVPSSRVVAENIDVLGVGDSVELLTTSAFLWAKRDLGMGTPAAPPTDRPWVVFCSPPYDFFVERASEIGDLIQRVQTHAPPESLIVVEADDRFDFTDLGAHDSALADWDIRRYPPAVVGIWRQNLPLTRRTGPAT